MKKVNSDHLKQRYKALSNLVRFKTRQDTKSYVSSLSQSCSVSTKKFWRFLNSVKGRHSPIPPLKHNNCFVPENIAKANLLNQYFFSVFTVEDHTHLSSLRSSLKFQPHLIQLKPSLSPLKMFSMNSPI